MPANALAEGTDGNSQSAVSSSQSVDKGSTGTGDTGAAAAEQNNEEKEVDQGAEKAIPPSSEQQNQLTAAGNSSETVTEETANNNSDLPEYLRTQIENERKVAFDSDDEASIGGTSYKTIDQALDKAKDGDTITLLRDVNRDFEITTYSETDTTKIVRSINKGGIDIPAGKNITLNLNAHQVMTSEENGHKYSIKVASGSTVRIVNQPTSARKAKLGTIDSSAVQETQREVGGKAVLTSGIVNEGTVTLDNTQGKIYLNNDNGYSFYNRGSLILQGDYSTGYHPPALSWLRLTLNIIEQTKDAKVSFADGFDADRLSFQLPDEVLSELNDSTPKKSVRYTLVDQGTERVWYLINSNSSSVSGLTNENVQKKIINDEKSMILYLKGTDPEDQPDKPGNKDYRRVYLNGETGKDNLNNQGLDRGLESDKPVKTFAEAKRVYYEAKKEHYSIDKIEIDGTVTVGTSEETWNSSNAGNTDTMKDNNIQSSGVSPAAGDDLIKRGATSGDAGTSDVKSADTSDNDNSADSNTITIVRGSGFNGYLVKVPEGRTLTLENIILDGNQDNATKTEKSLIDSEDGTLYIYEGTVLQNNKLTKLGYFEACGGAVHASGGIVNMTGGIIRDNTANYGGGIYADNGAVLKMSGGSIQKNHAVDGTSPKELGYAAGGGVALYQGDTIMNFAGGSIERNISDNLGGGISVGTSVVGNSGPETLNMSGGTVDRNSAGSGGGGIYIQGGYPRAVGSAKITGGTISNNSMTGDGSGYTEFGGGGIYVNGVSEQQFENGRLNLENALIHDNSAQKAGGGYASCPTSETHIYVTNGAAFYKNASVKTAAKDLDIEASSTLPAHVGSPEYTISESMLGGNPYHWKYDDNQEVPMDKLSGTLNALWNEKLHLHTDETADQEAEKRAQVKIYGNTSATRGGGIGSNGTVTIGEEDTTKVTAQKKWDDDNQSAKRPGSIQVQLFRSTKSDLSDKQYIGYITLTPDKDGNWTNTAEFKNLARTDASGNEYIYTVGEKKMDGYDATVTQDEKTKDFTITNKPSQTPPTPTPSPTYRHVTVQKTWTLDDGKTRPDSIQVQLMKDGVAYGSPVTLNDANSWTFTWNNLENDGSQWTVNEVLVPQGFTESQKITEESNGLRVVINNDDQPTKPNKPTNSTKPNKPTNLKTPAKTNTSVTPKTPVIHQAATHNTSAAPASSVPRTSDATRLGTMLIVFGGAAALLALLLAVKRRKVSK
ncbi:MAG: Cna B-type domain-containing protein [Eubacterium sp.]|nr:Cna B-type domain-containing protein [Eubacterium sp.]MCH4110027.1 Cna B-type domain-containing protein [Eubacterium sp.]